MSYVNRFLVALLALAVIIVGAVILLVAAGVMAADALPGEILSPQFQSIIDMTDGERTIWAIIGGGLVVIGLAVLAIELAYRGGTGPMVLVSSNQNGVVRVSLKSIQELAERTAREHGNVKSVGCRVRSTNAGLRIECITSLTMGSDIPQTSTQIQASVKEAVEALTGLPVDEVSVRATYKGNAQQSLAVR